MAIREIEARETALAHPAMRALRPAYSEQAEFVARVDGVQRAEGYRLAGLFEPGRTEAAAVAGFRCSHRLAWGRCLYVDDLSTLPDARRRGHASRLMDWLIGEARRLGCESLHLDSGVGPDRADAHRLYLKHGLDISAHHFSCAVEPGEAVAR